MQPVVRVAEMAAIDAEAPEPVQVLVDRAGRAVARVALDMLGGTYGRRVVVVAGKGNNGEDGRTAARHLERRGIRCRIIDATTAPVALPQADLVIDAAYGTGLTRDYVAPDPGAAQVLAVDIPSGIAGDTGELLGHPMAADVTVTFAAAKPGLLLGAGPDYCGHIVVADIGLDVSRATVELVDDDSVAGLLPVRSRTVHKWSVAVLVVAGQPGMTGAAVMCAAAAQRAGAGMVQVVVPGVEDPPIPTEAVAEWVERAAWVDTVVADLTKAHAVIVGPGLGTSMVDRHQVRAFLGREPRPVIVDGDGLTALGHEAIEVLADRTGPAILTPHDGEFERLTGTRPGPRRLDQAQEFAIRSGTVTVLKGPTTIIAAPDGAIRLVTSGDERLATAGTGDVLAGTIGALAAAGLPSFDAAAAGAHLHGVAGTLGPDPGTIASDVIAQLPAAWAAIIGATDE